MTLRVLLLLSISALSPYALDGSDPQREIGRVGQGAKFVAIQSDGKWGLAVTGAGMASGFQPQPVTFEFYKAPDTISHRSSGYDRIEISSQATVGIAEVAGPDKTHFTVEDRWRINGSEIQLSRKVTASGTADYGFLTSISFSHPDALSRSEVDYFAPGMIYGSPDHLTTTAIGGSATYGPEGHGEIQIREDRLPAPVFGVHFSDGSALTLLDPAPNGATTKADSHDTDVHTMVDEKFQFGAVGVHLAAGHHEQGFWFPGTEGEVTYRGDTYPGGQLQAWRRRYHPVQDGLTQNYRVHFRFTTEEKFPAYYRNAWRWAYDTLKPPVTWQDLALIQRSIIDVLASQVQVEGDRAGIPNFLPAVPDQKEPTNHKVMSQNAILGFTGKNLESAEFLLADAQVDQDAARADRDRNFGLAIFKSFARLKVDPPVGEGFDIKTGEPQLAIPRDHRVYLRSFGDDMKATLRAYRREKRQGNLHPDWLAWTRQFGNWLLTQQRSDGGFPRAWVPVSGAVADASPASTYNPVPFLVLLTRETGDSRYLSSAERAGDFMWTNGQSEGRFVGGTIDNPDVLDKEAGTLSTEAYLALFDATKNSKWLDRARVAGDYAETYIYIWNVPMPADENDALLHWKKGVPTYGTELIATGHTLVDDYMSFDVDEYARLGRWTGDRHYLSIATLLLHDTKNMIAIPGRIYDLKGPGWQQEHWSFAPVRGFGLHRGWLPWVATSQLKGMFGLRDFDPQLYRQLAAPNPAGTN